MDGVSPFRGKDTTVEVDRGRFGKLMMSTFQPTSRIRASRGGSTFISAVAIYIFLDPAHHGRNTPIGHHSCARTASVAAISAPDECHRWTDTRSAPDEAPGAFGRPLRVDIVPQTGRKLGTTRLPARLMSKEDAATGILLYTTILQPPHATINNSRGISCCHLRPNPPLRQTSRPRRCPRPLRRTNRLRRTPARRQLEPWRRYHTRQRCPRRTRLRRRSCWG